MLTKGDDFPLHQTSDPIAFAGTDRNFYDRYFFNGYGPDGEDFFAVAFGVYPHLNVVDAHFSCLHEGQQHCLHASALLRDRMDLRVGPVRIEVVEPLAALRVVVDASGGFAADMLFTARHAPIEEPRFTRRLGPRSLLDYTRLTQNGHWSGWFEVDGRRVDLGRHLGTRDRSWGVRPIGARDSQPVVPEAPPQFFWLWSPVNFADESLFFHLNADEHGRPWNVRAVRVADLGEAREHDRAEMALQLAPPLRHATAATLHTDGFDAAFTPLCTFMMRGIGYGHPDWAHGGWKGEQVVERESFEVVPQAGHPLDLHVQAVCRVALDDGREGMGVLEQLILGPYAPLGLRSAFGE